MALAREAQAFFAAGFRLIAISADDVEGCGRLRAATDGAIAIVSDPGAGFIMDLELTTTDPMVEHLIAQPAVFVVDDTGVVRYRYLSRSPDDRPKTALLLLAVERLASAAPKASSRI